MDTLMGERGGDKTAFSEVHDSHMTSEAASLSKLAKKLKTKPLAEVLAKVLPMLQRKDDYQFFAYPVNSAEVPDYYTIIRHPMDFSTMEKTLSAGEYKSLEEFKNDFLLITENARYFNAIDGPSGIIHTEAKKLQEWGLKVIAREGTAIQDDSDHDAVLESASLDKQAASAATNGKLNIRLKKMLSPSSSATATPRVATPSRLIREIKVEDDIDEEEQMDDENDDFDEYSETGTSSGRGISMSIDDSGTPGTRDSPDLTHRRYTKRNTGPRAPYTHKKNRPRQSAVLALLTTSTKDEDGVERSTLAPVSSMSGVAASSIPLLYGADGSIALERLTEDERRTLLRASNLDQWPDVLTPFVESIVPLHTDIQPQIGSIVRATSSIVDGLGSAIMSASAPISTSFNYTVDGFPADQQKSPFAISSGDAFHAKEATTHDVPLAWPRPNRSSAPNVNSNSSTGGNETGQSVKLKGKDREKERGAVGVGNLDDWSFTRAHLSKMIEPLDLGLYPGLLPAAWIDHIKTSKGGPARSRLPPYHLSVGSTYENALQEELASVSQRVLLSDVQDNGITSSDVSNDLCSAFSQHAAQDWQLTHREKAVNGVRGSDIIREVVYGGALGEAYASSIYDFVSGAADMVLQQEVLESDDDTESKKGKRENDQDTVPTLLDRMVPSYFDNAGEMLDQESYMGMSLIPLDVRKEAGLSGRPARSPSTVQPQFESSIRSKRSIREVSVPLKRQRTQEPPLQDMIEGEVRSQSISEKIDNDITSSFMKGGLLDRPLVDYVRDCIVSPLSGHTLDALVDAGNAMHHSEEEDLKELDSAAVCELSQLLDQHSQLQEVLCTLPISRSIPIRDKDEKITTLVAQMKTGHYKQVKQKMIDMTLAKKEVIELETLVKTKEEMLNESLQTNEALPLRWTSMEIDGIKIDKALHQYASILSTISNQCQDEKRVDAEILNQLRLAYIALAKLVPTKELSRGQWAAWAEYLQQQVAHQKQWQQKQNLKVDED